MSATWDPVSSESQTWTCAPAREGRRRSDLHAVAGIRTAWSASLWLAASRSPADRRRCSERRPAPRTARNAHFVALAAHASSPWAAQCPHPTRVNVSARTNIAASHTRPVRSAKPRPGRGLLRTTFQIRSRPFPSPAVIVGGYMDARNFSARSRRLTHSQTWTCTPAREGQPWVV